MKLIEYENLGDYKFTFLFENQEKLTTHLKALLSSKVSIRDLKTAHLDKEWGCLEFKDGMVDIEPKTLYSFCKRNLI